LLKEFSDPEPCSFDEPRCPATDASFSPDGRRLVVAFPTVGRSVVWDTRTGAVIGRLQNPVFNFRAVFSADGSRIVTASPDSLRIWDAVHYEPLLTLPLDELPGKLTFTPDGSRLLGLTEAGVRMWQTIAPPQTGHP
jgi:WD40 repeat protein